MSDYIVFVVARSHSVQHIVFPPGMKCINKVLLCFMTFNFYESGVNNGVK